MSRCGAGRASSAGYVGPLLAYTLARWMPPAVAVGLAFFVMWVVVGIVFTISPPIRQWNLARWASGGALGAFVAGALAFVFHM